MTQQLPSPHYLASVSSIPSPNLSPAVSPPLSFLTKFRFHSIPKLASNASPLITIAARKISRKALLYSSSTAGRAAAGTSLRKTVAPSEKIVCRSTEGIVPERSAFCRMVLPCEDRV